MGQGILVPVAVQLATRYRFPCLLKLYNSLMKIAQDPILGLSRVKYYHQRIVKIKWITPTGTCTPQVEVPRQGARVLVMILMSTVGITV